MEFWFKNVLKHVMINKSHKYFLNLFLHLNISVLRSKTCRFGFHQRNKKCYWFQPGRAERKKSSSNARSVRLLYVANRRWTTIWRPFTRSGPWNEKFRGLKSILARFADVELQGSLFILHVFSSFFNFCGRFFLILGFEEMSKQNTKI